MARDLAADSDLNFCGTWRDIGRGSADGDVEEDDGVLIVRTGAALPPFNPVFVKCPPDDAGALFARATGPCVVVTRAGSDAARSLGRVASDVGFVQWTDMPGMALGAIPREVPLAPDELAITDVAASGTWGAYIDVLADAFGMATDLVGPLSDPSMYQRAGWTALLATVRGVPIATSAVFVTGDVAGIYNVATVERYRGRGYGEALTWAAVDVGRRAGCAVAVLQATDMGLPVYERMGFRLVAPYARFASTG
jgi:GNAT superfamily N-acetyltransferase